VLQSPRQRVIFATVSNGKHVQEESKKIAVAFTGHRHYNGEADALLETTIRDLYAQGKRIFWSGMACGFDLAAAACVVALREELPGLELGCAIPCPNQAAHYSAPDRARYEQLLAVADRVELICERKETHCYLIRDRWMVDRSTVLVAWYRGVRGGTRYTWSYASRRLLQRINLWALTNEATLLNG
jgi:uncharacterized phage-like protein YoqJ